MAIFGNKDKRGNFTINFMSVKGTILYEEPITAISATLLDNKIEFRLRLGKKAPVYLEFSKITKVEIVDEQEIIEKNKSVTKRAVVGGLLLGPLGAIVGGIDGTGKKQKTKYRKYLVFSYISNNEERTLPIEIVDATIGLSKFIQRLSEVCPNLESKNNTINSETYL